MRKMFGKSIILGLLLAAILPVYINGSAYAAIGDCRELLPGMVSWDCHTNTEPDNESELTGMIAQIVTNILSDLSAIAVYIALGYVIYGGYKYMFAAGDVGKIAIGKKTLVQAFTGLTIVMLSSVIFSAIRIALSANGASFASANIKLPDVQVQDMVVGLFDWFIGISGVVAAIFLVYGGFSYMTSAGDAGKLTKAKNVMIYSLIGLAIVGLSAVITGFVRSNIEKAKAEATSLQIIDNEKGLVL